MVNGKEICKRYDRLVSKAAMFRTAWQELAPFIESTRFNVLAQPAIQVQGQAQTNEVFDSTSNSACAMLSSFVFGKVINPATKWMRYKVRQTKLSDLDEVQEWRDEVSKIFLSTLGNSNFYLEAYENLIDHNGFGTCDLHIEAKQDYLNEKPLPGFKGFNFRAYKIGTFYIEENANGEVDTRYCSYSLSARAIRDEFGDNLPPKILHCLQPGNDPDKMFEIIHAIEPRPYREQASKAAKHMPVMSTYVERETGFVIRESGYRRFPDAIARYAKTPGEAYGRGPGWLALPEIKSLNQLKYDEFEGLEMAMKPPIMSALEEGSIGTIQMFPGGFMTVKLRPGMNDVRQAMAPFESGTKWPIVNLKEEEIRHAIERIFLVREIRQLIEAEKAQTAYEYAKKEALVMQMMGPMWGRLQQEYLNRIADICFEIMYEQGALPPPPQALLEANEDIDIDVEYEGPLAKAQRSGELEAIMGYAQDTAVIAQFDPRAVDRFDSDEALKIIAEVRGTPAKVVRSDDQVLAIRDARRQAQEQETMKEDLMSATVGAKNLAPLAEKLVPSTQTAGSA